MLWCLERSSFAISPTSSTLSQHTLHVLPRGINSLVRPVCLFLNRLHILSGGGLMSDMYRSGDGARKKPQIYKRDKKNPAELKAAVNRYNGALTCIRYAVAGTFDSLEKVLRSAHAKQKMQTWGSPEPI